MTPEEIRKQIEANRRVIRKTSSEQLVERAVKTFTLDTEGEPEPTDEELETRRYEVTPEGAVEVPGE